MTIPQSLTREEAQRQIAELERHIASLPTNNHPSKIEAGMLFEHNEHGLCLTVYKSAYASDGIDLRFLDGAPFEHNKCFSRKESDFEYLGHAKDLLVRKTDKPAEVVVTDEMAAKAYETYRVYDGRDIPSMKHALTLALNGKL